jgi:hypothetical protein
MAPRSRSPLRPWPRGMPIRASGTPIPRALRGIRVEWRFDVLSGYYEHELFQNTFTLSYNRGLADSY